MKIDGTRRNDRATERVLAYYAAFNRGDWNAMLDCLDDRVAHDLNQGPRETGRAQFAAFLQRMATSYRERLSDIVVLSSPDGQRAAVEYVVHGEYLADDAGCPRRAARNTNCRAARSSRSATAASHASATTTTCRSGWRRSADAIAPY